MTRHTFDPSNPTAEQRAVLARAAADVRVMRSDAVVSREARASADAEALRRSLGDPQITDEEAGVLREACGGADPAQLAPDTARRMLADFRRAIAEADRTDALPVARFDEEEDDPVGAARARRDKLMADAWKLKDPPPEGDPRDRAAAARVREAFGPRTPARPADVDIDFDELRRKRDEAAANAWKTKA